MLCLFSLFTSAQLKIYDEAIVNQQERMVFKQWDEDKFTPKPGFLYLNPLYWMTWGLHPNYPDTDLRPLGPVGPQTQRLLLMGAMDQTDGSYLLHSDTLRNTALGEGMNYSSIFASIDPLWFMYYSREFQPLLQEPKTDPLAGCTPEEIRYLNSSATLQWYQEEREALNERLKIARSTTVERGSRIMAYHRLLKEYEKLEALWEDKKKKMRLYLALKRQSTDVKSRSSAISGTKKKSDVAIADEILKKSKL